MTSPLVMGGVHPNPKMSIKPKSHSLLAVRLATPAMLASILIGTTSWLGMPTFESASDSVQHSVFGMIVLSDEPQPLVDTTPGPKIQERELEAYDVEKYHHFGQDRVVFDLNPISDEDNLPLQLEPIPPASDSNTSPAENPTKKSQSKKKLLTRTYKVNPTTFLERINALFGVDASKTNRADDDIQKSVQRLFANLGINIPGIIVNDSGGGGLNGDTVKKGMNDMTYKDSKAFFLNDRNGTLFVRANKQDFQLLEAAIAALQEPAERNTKVTLNMHIVQLDESGINLLAEFGFDKPGSASIGQFEQTIDTPTLQRLLLRMNLAPAFDILHSPRITALNGRQSVLKAQELRRIVTHNESGNIQTEEVSTGPSLSIIPQIRPNGQLEMTVHFELLEFMGYDDPGPFRIVSQNGNTETASASTNRNRSTIDEDKEMIKEMESAPKRETPLIILKYMPNQIRLKHLSKELETAQQSKAQIESKVSRNAKDIINSHRKLAAVNDLISALQKQIDQEVASVRRHILAQMESQELRGDNENKPIESTIITASGNDSTENNPVPLPRFNRLELTTKTTLQSGQTLIMGGLKSIETIKWKNNIPVMSKLPLPGSMFRREGTSTTEQYIYVLITPQILE
jgi:hypothetical protein